LAVAIAAVVVWQANSRGQDLPILQVQGFPESQVLDVGVGACGLEIRVDVDESAAEVTVRVSVTDPMPEVCTQALQIVTVRLDSPLGERTVIDGSTGQAVVVEFPADWGSDQA
jgi:hypothetical protein